MNFHDVESDARGELVLTARVLLPNEVLGRFYHPRLASGVFLSATTWLRQGFEAAQGYLGLDRAAAPDEDEERPPSLVRTFRAPEVFDYSRVLVCVPRDVPPVARDKERFLAYVGEFLGRLGERTRGRVLGLFTNSDDLKRVGARLEGRFRARGVPLLYQGMRGTTKEELGDRFRAADSVLLGVDTFWYGADFPGECLEYLVIVKLPYGVPDRYHQAQCAAIGVSEQRRQIYMPKSLSKFRQGFGRLMRRESDRGCVFVRDGRALDPRHRAFLRELPVAQTFENDPDADDLARLVRGDTDHCVREALRHMHLTESVRERGLDTPFDAFTIEAGGREDDVA
jgi:ATP-dependent DNA helicase DinG